MLHQIFLFCVFLSLQQRNSSRLPGSLCLCGFPPGAPPPPTTCLFLWNWTWFWGAAQGLPTVPNDTDEFDTDNGFHYTLYCL